MIRYYFYNNVRINRLKISPFFILISCIFELHNILINISYLNKLYINNNQLDFKNKNLKFFNFYFFFNKIKKLSKIIKNIFYKNKRSKSWKSLIIFFFISINSFLSKKYFIDFNFNINLTSNNLINYSYYNNLILFKIKKRPARFSIFYFFIFIYKLYLSSKYSMFILKNLIYLDFDFILFLTIVKVKNHINHRFREIIYI